MILFRSRITLTAADQAAIILDDLDDLESDLNGGAVNECDLIAKLEQAGVVD